VREQLVLYGGEKKKGIEIEKKGGTRGCETPWRKGIVRNFPTNHGERERVALLCEEKKKGGGESGGIGCGVKSSKEKT